MSQYNFLFERPTIAKGQAFFDANEVQRNSTDPTVSVWENFFDVAQLFITTFEGMEADIPSGVSLAVSGGKLYFEVTRILQSNQKLTKENILQLAADTATCIANALYAARFLPGIVDLAALPGIILGLEVVLDMLAFAISAMATLMGVEVAIDETKDIVEKRAWEDIQDAHFQALAAQGRALAQSASSAQFQPMLNMVN
jgi:hypothetical protein